MTAQAPQSSRSLKSPEEIPGSYGLPLIGETIELFRDEELFYWRHFHKYGSIFKTRAMGKNFAFLIGPEANRLVMMEQADHVSTTLGWEFLRPVFGNGLLFMEGEKHRATRRLMYPAFHGRAIASYFDTIQSVAQDFVQDWATRETVNLLTEFRRLTLVIACRLFIGTQTASEVGQTSQWFSQLVKGGLSILRLDIPWTPYGRSQHARQKLTEFMRSVIAERQRQGNLQESRDVLGLLLAAVDEDGNHLSESEVIDHALFMLVAGHETTSNLLSWLVYELGAHPEWQSRLRSEQDAILKDAPLDMTHLKQLSHLTNVLKEGERLYPPVYGMPRGVVKDIEYAGYRIPAGWYVDVSPMLTHRLPELYAEPDRFDPDRFAPPREEDKQHPFALVGFGSGPHGCLGFEFAQMEMRVILLTLLRQYSWTVTPERESIAPMRQPSKLMKNLQARFTLVN
ncbi:MAG: cytochrome P450 [Drouetiella hepatica Uher 2000/2452]|jgi:cytochrome P450|uniref:Cytochrome P450 n=1 Tax=Drouetiella hepatica Uher 2000/2452 TaxID=904376 RepID=A0A951UMF7_9CYAN|nr:cytochrome P450 [Drouetiella hepatica Uher 2000/2452]